MSTELIAKNDVSKDLTAKLKDLGPKITDGTIFGMLNQMDATRANFETQMILTGIALLGKQSQLGNRKFKPWYENLSRQRASAIGDKSYSSIRTYICLAKRFLHQIECGQLEATEGTKLPQLDDLFQIVSEPHEFELIQAVTEFTQGRSLRQLLRDTAAANQDATAEIAEELKTKQLAGAQAAGGEDPKTGQFDFFGSLEKDFSPAVQTFETALDSPAWIRDDVSNEDKLTAITSLRERIKSLDTKLADKAKALKQGQAA